MARDDDARDAILKRRRRFIIAALSGVTAAAFGCDAEVETEDGSGTSGAGGVGGPQACLDFPAQGGGGQAGAQPCLTAPLGGRGGAGGTGGTGGTGGSGGTAGSGG